MMIIPIQMRLVPVILVLIGASIITPAYAEIKSCEDVFPKISHEITNGIVSSCVYSVAAKSLIVEFEAELDGRLDVKIPKNSELDTCNESDFIILLNDEETNFDEKKSSFSRTIIIPFKQNNSKIEIVSTYIPEYPHFPKLSDCIYEKSPKQQILFGITLDAIICDRDFILLERNSDNSVACVIPSTAETLVSRGWGNQMYRYDSDEVTTESGTETVKYRIRNGSVENITVDSQTRSMIVEMNSSDDGKIIITIPRAVLDSRLGPDGYSGEDDSFFVLIDGREIEYAERADQFNRELTIPFVSGSRQIEIIGSFPLSQGTAITNDIS